MVTRLRLQSRTLSTLNLFVDTSVWSLALRRDAPERKPEVAFLADALGAGSLVFTTSLVLQELLQGFVTTRSRKRIIDRFNALPFLVPDRADHIEAARVRTACRRKGVEVGTIDALLAQLCMRHDLTMLTLDTDFSRVAQVLPLLLWKS